MKCIVKNGEYKRVDNETADIRVKTQGWSYSNKTDWKKNARTQVKTEPAKVIDSKGQKTKERRAEKHINLKNKQRQ